MNKTKKIISLFLVFALILGIIPLRDIFEVKASGEKGGLITPKGDARSGMVMHVIDGKPNTFTGRHINYVTEHRSDAGRGHIGSGTSNTEYFLTNTTAPVFDRWLFCGEANVRLTNQEDNGVYNGYDNVFTIDIKTGKITNHQVRNAGTKFPKETVEQWLKSVKWNSQFSDLKGTALLKSWAINEFYDGNSGFYYYNDDDILYALQQMNWYNLDQIKSESVDNNSYTLNVVNRYTGERETKTFTVGELWNIFKDGVKNSRQGYTKINKKTHTILNQKSVEINLGKNGLAGLNKNHFSEAPQGWKIEFKKKGVNDVIIVTRVDDTAPKTARFDFWYWTYNLDGAKAWLYADGTGKGQFMLQTDATTRYKESFFEVNIDPLEKDETKFSFKIIKKDNELDTPIQGVNFRVTGEKIDDVITTDNTGVATWEKEFKTDPKLKLEEQPALPEKLNLRIEEIQTKPNYIKSFVVENIELSKGSPQVLELEYRNERQKGILTITKVDQENNYNNHLTKHKPQGDGKLDGAVFEIRAEENIFANDIPHTLLYSKGDLVDTLVIQNGKATSKEIDIGKYRVTETKLPRGYWYKDYQKEPYFFIWENDYSTEDTRVNYHEKEVENAVQKGHIEIHKVLEGKIGNHNQDDETNKPLLADSYWGVYLKSKDNVGNKGDRLPDEFFKIKSLDKRDIPVVNPTKDFTSSIPRDEQPLYLVLKTDKRGNAGTNIANSIVWANGQVLTNNTKEYALPYGEYIVKELNSPEGYTPSFFEVFVDKVTDDLIEKDNTNKYQYIFKGDKDAIENKIQKQMLKIIKVDKETGDRIKFNNANYQIISLDPYKTFEKAMLSAEYDNSKWVLKYDGKNVLDENLGKIISQPEGDNPKKFTSIFSTNNEGEVILPTPLHYGKYVLMEIKAPEGYVLTEALGYFEVKEPKNHTQNTDENRNLEVIDNEGNRVKVPKIIELEVYQRNIAQKGSITIRKVGEKITGFEKYTDKYLAKTAFRPKFEYRSLDEGVEFEIYANEDIYVNEKLVHKKGDLVHTVITDKTGVATSPIDTKEQVGVNKLYLGKYLVKEKKTNKGYLFTDNTQYEVEFSYAGQNVTIVPNFKEIKNKRQDFEINLKKEISDGRKANDIYFGVFADEDFVVNTKTDIKLPESVVNPKNVVLDRSEKVEKVLSFITNDEITSYDEKTAVILLNEFRVYLVELEKEILDLENSLSGVSLENTKLINEKITSLKTKLEKYKSSIEEYKGKKIFTKEMEDKLSELKEKIRILENNPTVDNSLKIKELDSKLVELEKEIQENQTNLPLKITEYENKKKEFDEKEQKIHQINEEIFLEKEKLNQPDVDNAHQKANEKIKALEEERTRELETLKELNTQKEELFKVKEDLREKIENLKEKKNDFEKTKENLEKTGSNKDKTIQDLKEEVIKLEKIKESKDGGAYFDPENKAYFDSSFLREVQKILKENMRDKNYETFVLGVNYSKYIYTVYEELKKDVKFDSEKLKIEPIYEKLMKALKDFDYEGIKESIKEYETVINTNKDLYKGYLDTQIQAITTFLTKPLLHQDVIKTYREILKQREDELKTLKEKESDIKYLSENYIRILNIKKKIVDSLVSVEDLSPDKVEQLKKEFVLKYGIKALELIEEEALKTNENLILKRGSLLEVLRVVDGKAKTTNSYIEGKYYVREIKAPGYLKPLEIAYPVVLKYDGSTEDIIKVSVNGGKAIINEPITPKIDPKPEPKNPKIGTKAHLQNNEKVGFVGEDIVLKDKVSYEDLNVGTKYILKGILMDKATNKPLMIDNKEVTAFKEFVASSSSGEIELEFRFNALSLKGKKVVVFERLYENDREIAVHTDINDDNQTVEFKNPKIGTKASFKNHKKISIATKNVVINDKVEYSDLIVGKEYILKGILMDKATNKPLMMDGKPYESVQKFVPEKEKGFIVLEFVVDAENLQGKSIVVFERLYENDREIAVHTDINDDNQTVVFPKIKTQVSTSYVDENKDVEIIDYVSYENLIVGKEYEVRGILIDKQTGKPLIINGKFVESIEKFKVESPNGVFKLPFRFNTTNLGNRTFVVFEEIYEDNILVGEHIDINDEKQTFKVRKIPKKPKTGQKEISKYMHLGVGIIFISLVIFIIRWKKVRIE